MKYQIRKCVTYTVTEATEAVSLDPEDFKNLEEFPFTGESEEEFLKYIFEFINRYAFDGFPEDLSDSAADELSKIACDQEYKEYNNTAWDGEDSWYEIGEVDEKYSKFGGFNSHFDTMS